MAHTSRGKKSSSLRRGAHISSQRSPFWNNKLNVNITNGCIICIVSIFNHTQWHACSCLIRRDEREKSAMQVRRDTCKQSATEAQQDACILSTSQARRDTCEQQGRPCSPGSELFDLHAPATARLAQNFSINGLIKAPGRRVFACDPMAAFALFVFSTSIPP